jgi:hypothetical protein
MRLTLLLLLAFAAAAHGQSPAQKPQVKDIEARLFCAETGRVTNDIIGADPMSLWNTIIGEGQGGCASTSTLLLVVVAGRKEEDLTAVRILIRAEYETLGPDSRHLLVTDTLPVGITGEDGLAHIPLWLSSTGCSSVQVIARLLEDKPESARQEVIHFECGE